MSSLNPGEELSFLSKGELQYPASVKKQFHTAQQLFSMMSQGWPYANENIVSSTDK